MIELPLFLGVFVHAIPRGLKRCCCCLSRIFLWFWLYFIQHVFTLGFGFKHHRHAVTILPCSMSM